MLNMSLHTLSNFLFFFFENSDCDIQDYFNPNQTTDALYFVKIISIVKKVYCITKIPLQSFMLFKQHVITMCS